MLPRLRTRIIDSEFEPLLPREHGLMFGAVILEDASNVFQQRKAENHDQKKRHTNHSVDQIESNRRSHRMKVATNGVPRARIPRLFRVRRRPRLLCVGIIARITYPVATAPGTD